MAISIGQWHEYFSNLKSVLINIHVLSKPYEKDLMKIRLWFDPWRDTALYNKKQVWESQVKRKTEIHQTSVLHWM